MKFSGKMYFEIILKVTKNKGFTLCLQYIFFEKPQAGDQIDLPAVSGLLKPGPSSLILAYHNGHSQMWDPLQPSDSCGE